MAKNQRDFFKKKNEWSEIKDTLLRCYLPQYFQKLLVSGKPIFYIDCFAGKGKFDDGNDGSPLIAMQIINERLGMSRISRKNNAIVPCFIELNHAADLEQNLMLHPYQYGTPQVVDGKFEDNIRGLLKDKRGYNVFLYIDPYGIQALDSQLFDEIGTYGFRSFEMLINFNSFGFFRDACRVMKVDISQDDALMGLDDLVEYEPTTVTASPQSENLLTRIAGGNYWMDIVRDFQMGRIDGYQAERRLSAEYKQHLKQKYKYVLDMPIRLKPGQRPKYRYACQLCHKPFSNVEMCQLEQKPDVELDPLNVCLCPNRAAKFRTLRNDKYLADRLIDSILDVSENEIEENDHVSVAINDYDFWFIPTHIAEIIELLKLKKKAAEERKAQPQTASKPNAKAVAKAPESNRAAPVQPVKEETPPSTPEPEEEGLQSDTSAYGELIGRRVFHKSKKAYARVVGCDGEYMVLNFESGDKAGQDVKYNLTMCLNNGWIEVVD